MRPDQKFPVDSWDRYEFLGLAGEGRIARVYKAYDPRLKRLVALKFIRGDDPQLAERFVREAQAQASLEHMYVCRVYEAGTVDGKFYIAMQFIEGWTIQEIQEEMTLEEKVRVISQVAEAIHQAHELGLIHRDLKPSNIMVEKKATGWHPFVMDFGLVRFVDAPGATMTGEVIGTPAYMAPEQATGGSRKVDYRTDVYSLGAALFELLTGEAPFRSATALETLMKVVDQEPLSPRHLNPSVPVDLETVVIKCLEKDPQRRYQSALGLAEDLQRFLDGEPLLARRSGLAYRFLRKARKHKLTTGAVFTVFFLAAIPAGMGIYALWTSAERAEFAQQFGQEVEKIESNLRHIYTLPIHDTRSEKEQVRAQMNHIEQQMKKAGWLAQGPGNYAIGRGYLAFHEYEKALAYLMKAWEQKYQTPDVALAIGQVMGHLYQKELAKVEGIESASIREARRQEIVKEFRDPSLQFLKKSSGIPGELSGYGEGLIAYYEQRYEDALQKADQAISQIPWMYEAIILKGDVLVSMGNAQYHKGSYEDALRIFQLADAAFRDGIRIGESDATCYERLCSVRINIMAATLYGQGENPVSYLDETIQACDGSLTIDPEQSNVYVRKSDAYGLWADFLLGRLGKSSEILGALDRSEEAAKRAILIEPQNPEAYLALGIAYRNRVNYEWNRGLNPENSVNLSIHNYETSIKLNPNSGDAYTKAGDGYNFRAMYEMKTGKDPSGSFRHAARNFIRASQIAPASWECLDNLGILFRIQGDYEATRGRDPTPFYRESVRYFNNAGSINRNYTAFLNNLGNVYRALGAYEFSQGRDPTAFLRSAIENYETGIQLYPEFVPLYLNAGIAYRMLGENEKAQDRDPTAFLDQALGRMDLGLKISQWARLHSEKGQVFLIAAEYQINRRGSVSPEVLAAAHEELKKALEIDSTDSTSYLKLGRLEIIKIRQRARSYPPSFRNAEEYIKKAIRLNPNNADSHCTLAELFLLESERNTHRNNSEVILQGLSAVESAISLHPFMPEALAIEGALHLVRARNEPDSSARSQAILKAKSLLQRALQVNQFLSGKYEPFLAEIHKISGESSSSASVSNGNGI